MSYSSSLPTPGSPRTAYSPLPYQVGSPPPYVPNSPGPMPHSSQWNDPSPYYEAEGEYQPEHSPASFVERSPSPEPVFDLQYEDHGYHDDVWPVGPAGYESDESAASLQQSAASWQQSAASWQSSAASDVELAAPEPVLDLQYEDHSYHDEVWPAIEGGYESDERAETSQPPSATDVELEALVEELARIGLSMPDESAWPEREDVEMVDVSTNYFSEADISGGSLAMQNEQIEAFQWSQEAPESQPPEMAAEWLPTSRVPDGWDAMDICPSPHESRSSLALLWRKSNALGCIGRIQKSPRSLSDRRKSRRELRRSVKLYGGLVRAVQCS